MTGKVHVKKDDVAKFWHHWKAHMPSHPASDDANSNEGVLRVPIGLAGDDAKYTLAGAKFIVVMLSSVLYKVKRHLALLLDFSPKIVLLICFP